jgi:NADPH-dependent F420 reductase
MIGFIGGTGPEGLGLALRFALAGEEVAIGSRKLERAEAAAAEIRSKHPAANVWGAENRRVVEKADVVFVTIPYAGQKETLASLRDAIGGKLVVDTVVPLAFEKGRARALPVAEGSAAEEAQAVLPQATVVAAFHNLSAPKLVEGDAPLDADVLVCCDDADARAQVMALAAKIAGVRPVDGGGLANARYVEQVTVLLVNLNRIHKAHTGIRITGL